VRLAGTFACGRNIIMGQHMSPLKVLLPVEDLDPI